MGNRRWRLAAFLGTVFSLFFAAGPAMASEGGSGNGHLLDLTAHDVGYFSLIIFALAYVLVILEEFTHLRKSKPVILVAGVIWGLIGYTYIQEGIPHAAEEALRHYILEFSELFLFLLAAMTFINAMEERNVFAALRSGLIRAGFGLKTLFWITGILAFCISPLADNLTTALLLGAVIVAVGDGHPKFIAIGCVNIVVAANAGGAFSPFGDITTLMVWQRGIIQFQEFFVLFVPALVSWLVPAFLMSRAVPGAKPTATDEKVRLRPGAIIIVLLFLCTIALAVSFHNYLGLPPVMGMMTGLALLQFFGYFLKNFVCPRMSLERRGLKAEQETYVFDFFNKIARAEWDTLLFFFGVIVAVGGLGFMGYLALVSETMYSGFGPTFSNILVGVLSAIIDNIPVMFAVLTMNPEMSHGQWLLVTLTAGIGGSLLSVGSAAGVALMGTARGKYTFSAHLKWTPAIALGYVAGITAHIVMNGL